MLELFRKHGELAGHEFLRHNGCMFVDFAALPAAAEVGGPEGGSVGGWMGAC